MLVVRLPWEGVTLLVNAALSLGGVNCVRGTLVDATEMCSHGGTYQAWQHVSMQYTIMIGAATTSKPAEPQGLSS